MPNSAGLAGFSNTARAITLAVADSVGLGPFVQIMQDVSGNLAEAGDAVPRHMRGWKFGRGNGIVPPMKRLLVFGYGYSARALASHLRAQGWDVRGTTRDGTPRGGEATLQWPGTEMARHLDWASHLLISAGPDAQGDPVLNALGDQLRAAQFDWVGYLSTTGVYGDHGGGWVDEGTPPRPETRRGMWRLAAEAAWRDTGLPVHVFRLAGIYGPGRGPFAKLRAGTARRIVKPNQVFSRIHVADIVQVLAASIARPNPGAVYNVCDDDPAPPEDVLEFAANLLGLPVPPAEDFATAEMTPMARSFYAASKRIRNTRIKTELGVHLAYPTYRAGLTALHAQPDMDL